MNKVRYIDSNPCQESWEKMVPIEGGKHCEVCQTKVYDLTGFSIEEIKSFKGKGYCVQLTEKQVDDFRYVHPLKRFAVAALFVFGTSLFTVSYAQELNDTVIEVEDSCVVKGELKRKGSNSVLANQPVHFDVEGKRYTTTTDENGNFVIALPHNSRISMSTSHSAKRIHFSTKDKSKKNTGVTRFHIRRIRGKF